MYQNTVFSKISFFEESKFLKNRKKAANLMSNEDKKDFLTMPFYDHNYEKTANVIYNAHRSGKFPQKTHILGPKISWW